MLRTLDAEAPACFVESYNYVTGQQVETSSFNRDGVTMSNVNP